ncbi:DUF3089 domain-containing protein [Chitiniphilus eburneus]|uniref:DUF3089 domain-containing protein n=1 Tax=Chitiniphilus eburneus TaxID=2571148 RepID=A0A4U0P906_9NEIS|nr:DUF3089 domain-containing protein [Chitiniphilus eburneus]TJZ64045.1 DUF3089 domain-containing protein [Chitiniphilus eburneus]
MNTLERAIIAVLLCAATALLGSCGGGHTDDATPGGVDYAQPGHWLHRPAQTDKAVDVFYLYPSAWHRSDGEGVISEIDSPMMLRDAPIYYAEQASVFDTVGNIYAPFYRQADVGHALSLPPDEREALVKSVPLADAIAAFDHFIRHDNQGRPFILASHSQGSQVMQYLMADYLARHPDVRQRMIAAYLIGYSITTDFLAANPHLKFAEGRTDTGVIVSYNTEAPGLTGENPVLLPHALAINPISWTRGPQIAPRESNLGSMLWPGGSPVGVAHLADARVNVERGVVECSSVDPATYSSPGMPSGVFHSSDYGFYYFNLRQNAEERAAAYLAGAV